MAGSAEAKIGCRLGVRDRCLPPAPDCLTASGPRTVRAPLIRISLILTWGRPNVRQVTNGELTELRTGGPHPGVMIADQRLEAAADAFRQGAELIADSASNGRFEAGSRGTALLFTGTWIPLLNGVLGLSETPDPGEVAAFADEAAGYAGELPWTIRLRGEASEELAGIAAGHGLQGRTESALMLLSLPVDVAGAGHVRKLAGAEYQTFADVLGAAFGAPPQIITDLYGAATLDRPEIDAYVAEDDGVPRTVGLSVRTGDHVYFANIATDPAYRRQGFASALIGAMLRDGHAAGARTAFLHSGTDTAPLFERFGFEAVETWTTLGA
ncbi:GNAT family N-acetyltransferase [Micromonospora sp. NPDC050397]|uniref:GNAT family N-acetyltransferase n=1 Tax=Micromonospora sp. NPDC050397 TaxID=3364279 RepID=UPI00384EE9FA